MLVEYFVCFLLIFDVFQIVTGISNNENLIDEEFHRAAEPPTSLEQSSTNSLKRDLFSGLHHKFQHLGYGASNLGHFQGHNIRPHYVHGFGEEVPNYGHLPSGGGGLAYGHTGGGHGSYGHTGGGVGLYGGHIGGGGDILPYGHSGGVAPYGHSGGGVPYGNSEYGHSGYGHSGYGHSGGGYGYDHDEGYGLSGIGQYLKKKITLKKIILPLAGLALVAAAGALSTSNPILLQLGTISGTSRGKRSLKEKKYEFPLNPFVRPTAIN